MSLATRNDSRAETPRSQRERRLSLRWPSVLAAAVVAVAYFLSGTLGLRLAYVHGSATAVWPPTGISIAALLLGGYALAPGVFVGAFFVNLLNPATYGAIGLSL